MLPDYFSKKQVTLATTWTKFSSCMLELLLLSFIFSPIMRYVSFYLFKSHFADFLNENNFQLNEYIDLKDVILSEAFKTYLTQMTYFGYFTQFVLAQFMIFGIYYVFFWTKFGVTPVGMFFRVKIIDYENKPRITLSKALTRYVFLVLAPINLIFSIARKDNRGVQDIIANTIVVKS